MVLRCIRCGRTMKNYRTSGMGYICEKKSKLEKNKQTKSLWEYE